MPHGIDDWKREVFKLLGEKLTERSKVNKSPLQPRPRSDADFHRPTEPITGKGPAKYPMEKFFASQSFGDDDMRHDRSLSDSERRKLEGRQNRNKAQKELGTATDVAFKGLGSHTSVQIKGTFYSGKGYNLKDNGFQPDTSKPVVLFLSGSGGSAEHYGTDIAEQYQELGASVLTCDYAGYGGSGDADVCEKGLYEDAQAMLEHLISLGYRTEDIVIHGYSLGGAVAGNLEERNEGLGNKFRGAVFDRPMVSLDKAVRASAPKGARGLAANWAKADLGPLSLEDALDHMIERDGAEDSESSSPIGGRFITSGNAEDHLGAIGHDLRESKGLLGADTDGGHGDHAAMFDHHRDAFRTMLFPDDATPTDRERDWIETEGSAIENPTATIDELTTIFRTTYNNVQQWIQETVTIEFTRTPDPPDDEWKTRIVDGIALTDRIVNAVADLDQAGLLDAKEFATEAAQLKRFQDTALKRSDRLKKKLTDAGMYDPTVDYGALSRLMEQIANTLAAFEKAGGASGAKTEEEDEILELSTKLEAFGCLGDFLLAPRATKDEQAQADAYAFQYELLQDTLTEIGARRKAAGERLESIKDETARINTNLRSRPKENLKNVANAEMTRRSAAGLAALRAPDEDVSRSKLIGRSSDAGYKKRVTTPIAQHEPIFVKVEAGDEISAESIQRLEELRLHLQGARAHYFDAYDGMSDRKKRSSAGEQRKKKYEAIDARLVGLGQIIDLARSRETVAKEAEEARILQIEGELRNNGVFDDLAKQLNTLTEDDPKELKELGKMLGGLDPLTRKALLKQNHPPKGLALLLNSVAFAKQDNVVDDLVAVRQDDDDSAYMHELIEQTISQEVARQTPETLFRSNSITTKLTGRYNRSRNADYATSSVSGGLEAVAAMTGVHELDRAKLEPGEDVDANFVKHAEAFDSLMEGIKEAEVPTDVSRICATMHREVASQFGPPERTVEEAEELGRRAASAHFILRVLNPTLFDAPAAKTDAEGNSLSPEKLKERQRNTVILSSVLQALSNGVEFSEGKPLAILNQHLGIHADSFNELIDRVIREGRAAMAPPEPPPRRADPRARGDEDSELALRLKDRATPVDLLFELAALSDEGMEVGFNVATLTSLYNEARDAVGTLGPGKISATESTLRALQRFIQRVRDRSVLRVLGDKLLRPLVSSFEEHLSGAEADERQLELESMFKTPEEFLRSVARSSMRLAELLDVDVKVVREMGRMVSVINNPLTPSTGMETALGKIGRCTSAIKYHRAKRWVEGVVLPAPVSSTGSE